MATIFLNLHALILFGIWVALGVQVDNYVKLGEPKPCQQLQTDNRNSTAARSTPHKIFYPRIGWQHIDLCSNLESIPLYSIFSKLLDEGDGYIDVGQGYGENIIHLGNVIGKSGFIASFCSWDHISLVVESTIKSRANGLASIKIMRYKKYPSFRITDVIPLNVSVYEICSKLVPVGEKVDDHFKFVCEEPSLTTYGYDVFQRTCPKAIVFNVSQSYHDDVNTGYIPALMGAQRLIADCQPSIFVEDVTPTGAQALFDVLNLYRYENIYWHVSLVRPAEKLFKIINTDLNGSEDEDEDESRYIDPEIPALHETRLSVSIFAIGKMQSFKLTDEMIQNFKLIKYVKRSSYLFQYDLTSLGEEVVRSPRLDVWKPSCVDGTLPPCHKYTRTIHTADITSVDTASGVKFHNTVKEYKPKFDSAKLQQLQLQDINISFSFHEITHPTQLGVSFPNSRKVEKFYESLSKGVSKFSNFVMVYQFMTSSAAKETLAQINCYTWIQNIYVASIHDFLHEYTKLSGKEVASRFATESKELNALIQSCMLFVSKQYDIRRDALTTAAISTPMAAEHRSLAKNNKNSKSAPTIDNENEEQEDDDSSNQDVASTRYMEPYQSGKHFDPNVVVPFKRRYRKKSCYEPTWCAQTEELQRRIRAWQFPDDPRSFLGESRHSSINRTCANSKFLVYDPFTDRHGIGSMIEQIASAFRYAMCLDRILVVLPIRLPATWTKWRHPGCRGNPFECYFEAMHGCTLSEDDIIHSPVPMSNDDLESYPLKNARVVRFTGLPFKGKCKFCGGGWDGSRKFFDGLVTDQFDFTIDPNGMGSNPRWTAMFDARTDPLDFNAFTTPIKLPWIAQFTRYIVRPRKWFASYLQDLVKSSLRGPNNTVVKTIPHPFVSLHVRYGFKFAEDPPEPLSRYKLALDSKMGGIKHVFVSTETEKVISKLRQKYTDLRIYSLKYPRIEYLQLNRDTSAGHDYIQEFVYSMANLYVSVEADGFIGTLGSNWCRLIQSMEHTRGDGGVAYVSVDRGSKYTTCL